MTKQCTKCGETKPLDGFHKKKTGSHGRQPCCKDCRSAFMKGYYQANKETIDAARRAYYRANRKEHNRNRTERRNRRYHSDPAYRILLLCRSRVRLALAGRDKAASTRGLIGCDIEHLKFHIESQFTNGMTWENQGEWHLDHIQPCASFDLTDPEQQKVCFHYTNLQPLWAEDNLKKSDNAPDQHQIKLI